MYRTMSAIGLWFIVKFNVNAGDLVLAGFHSKRALDGWKIALCT